MVLSQQPPESVQRKKLFGVLFYGAGIIAVAPLGLSCLALRRSGEAEGTKKEGDMASLLHRRRVHETHVQR